MSRRSIFDRRALNTRNSAGEARAAQVVMLNPPSAPSPVTRAKQTNQHRAWSRARTISAEALPLSWTALEPSANMRRCQAKEQA